MSVQKQIQDYYEALYEEYPTIPKEDIRRICTYGFKSLYLHNSYGGDTCISRKGFWFYCGSLMCDSIKYYKYYCKKMAVKLRVIYKRKKIKWNGYYYFALYKSAYDNYVNQKNKKGRPRKNFEFNKVFLYKIHDECSILESSAVAIFRIPMPIDFGFTAYREKLVTDKAELLYTRNPMKFKEVLLSTYDYEFITDLKRRYKKKKNE